MVRACNTSTWKMGDVRARCPGLGCTRSYLRKINRARKTIPSVLQLTVFISSFVSSFKDCFHLGKLSLDFPFLWTSQFVSHPLRMPETVVLKTRGQERHREFEGSLGCILRSRLKNKRLSVRRDYVKFLQWNFWFYSSTTLFSSINLILLAWWRQIPVLEPLTLNVDVTEKVGTQGGRQFPGIRLSASKSSPLWGSCSQPVGGDPLGFKPPFHSSHWRPSVNTDVYIVIHDSRKIIVMM